MSRLTITPDNLGPLIQVINLLCLAWIAVAILGRGATKLWVIRKLSFDDILMICCFVFSIGQSVAISVAAARGLGQHESAISSQDLSVVQKAVYTGKILFIPNLVCAKLAVLTTLSSLSPVAPHQYIIYVLQGIIASWGVSGVLVTALECKGSRPWDWSHSSCLSQDSVGQYIASINLFTEFALIVLPCIIISWLQLKTKRKMKILMAFACRIFAVAAIAIQMAYLARKTTGDRLFDMWVDTVCMQVVQCAVIFATCLVFLKPYLECLESGFLRIDDIRRKTQSGFSTSRMQYMKNSNRGTDRSDEVKKLDRNLTHTTVSRAIELDDRDGFDLPIMRPDEEPAHSRQSLTGQQGIVETRSWKIESSSLDE